MWKASAFSAPAASPVKIAFSSRNVSLATEKSVTVSTLVATLSAVLKKNRSAAGVAGQRVVALAAIELVGAGVASDEIVDLVGGEVDGGDAGGVVGPQCLGGDASAEPIGHRRVHVVGASGDDLDDLVHRVVDQKRVVASVSGQRVGAGPANKEIVVVVADNDVVELVAGAVDRRLRYSVRFSILAARLCVTQLSTGRSLRRRAR